MAAHVRRAVVVGEQPWLDGDRDGCRHDPPVRCDPDPYGLDTWNLAAHTRVFVHIVNSDMWRDITGEAPSPTPVTARTYTSAGLPWFAFYDETHGTIAPTAKLAGLKSVKQMDATRSTKPLQDDRPVQVKHVRHLWEARRTAGGRR